jgi:hypothetical protein
MYHPNVSYFLLGVTFVLLHSACQQQPEESARQPMSKSNGESRVLQVRVLGVEGCANALRAAELIEKEAAALGLPLDLQRVVVRTEEQARQEHFLGSPTVQIAGQDLEPRARGVESFTLS